jgi:hypothetical protein
MSTREKKLTPVIARRQLREADTQKLIEILVYQPVEDPDSEHGDWICRIEIVRGGTLLPPAAGHGVDSLQALINGIDGVRHALKDFSRNLIWLSGPGEVGFPLMVQEEDPDFIALVESVLDAEYSRQILFKKALRRAKEKK